MIGDAASATAIGAAIATVIAAGGAAVALVISALHPKPPAPKKKGKPYPTEGGPR